MNRNRHRIRIAIVILVFAIMTILFTYPLIFHLNDHIYRAIGDPLAVSNIFFWNYQNLFNQAGNLFDFRWFYPDSLSATGDIVISDLILFAPFYFISKNPVFATNMVVVLSFFLSAVSMFFLVYYWSGRLPLAFIAGLIFGFSPLRLGNGQIIYMIIFWIPLFFIFLDRYLKKMKIKDLIIAAILYSIQVLSGWYTGYMFTLLILIYLTLYYLINKTRFELKRLIIRSVPGIILVLVLVGPFAYYFSKLLSSNEYAKPLGETVQYSASPDDYFIADNHNRIIGRLRFDKPVIKELPLEKKIFETALGVLGERVNKLGVNQLPGEDIQEKLPFDRFLSTINKKSNEKNLFLGIVPLILSIIGIKKIKRLNDELLRNLTLIFSIIALIFLIFSFGPFLMIFGHFTYIPLPYLLLYYVFPAFDVMRVPARFGYMVMFAVSILSISGLAYLMELLKNKKQKIVLFVSVVFLFSFEAASFPIRMEKVPVKDEVPEVYYWLRDYEIDGGIAEVPSIKGNLTRYDEVYGHRRHEFIKRETLYWYFSNYHMKHVINGYATFFPDSYFEITRSLNNISSPESAAILKKYDVNLFILHRNLFDSEDILNWSEENIELAGLEVVKVFGSDVVLKWKK